MKRVARRDDALDRFKGGVSLVCAIGFIGGLLRGFSAIAAHRLTDSGLPNLAIALFVEELNSSFLRTILTGVPFAFGLYFLYRVAPRSFRRSVSILVLVLLVLLASRSRILWGTTPESGMGALLVIRRAFLVLACVGLARLFQETISFFRLLQQLGSLRIVLVVLFLLAVANSGATINKTKNFPRGPNIVLVTFDSIRPDHLGMFGYGRDTSPSLDRIAAKAIVFRAAYTSAPASMQALASIHTGRYAAATGVRRMWDRLRDQEVTLAEILADKGYVTGGFVGLPSPPGTSGLEQGYDRFLELGTKGADAVTTEAIRWIDRQEKRPFLAWVHYRDAEMPYAPPSGAAGMSDVPYSGRYRSSFRYEPTRGCRVFGHEKLAPEDSAQAVALYDGEIRNIDGEIGRLILHLEQADRIHDTLVLVVGTHGESLGEHGYAFDHGEFLFDTCLHVPMLLSAANLPTLPIETQVRIVDLLPTVLDILHLPGLPGVGGRSLLGAVERPGEFPDLMVFAESEVSLFPKLNARRPVEGIDGKLYAIREKGWKYVAGPRGPIDAALYDLTNDPGETLECGSSFPDVAANLRSALAEWEAGFPRPSNEKESPPPPWVYLANDPEGSTPSAPSGIPR